MNAVHWEQLPRLPEGPWLGNAVEFWSGELAFLGRLQDLGSLSGYRMGPKRCVLACEPAVIGQILVEKASSFKMDPVRACMQRQLFGRGLVTGEGPEQARQKSAAKPPLAQGRIPGYVPAMAELADAMLGSWQGQTSLDLHPAMAQYTLRVACQTLFLEDPGPGSAAFVAAVSRAMDRVHAAALKPWKEPWLYLSPAHQKDLALIRSFADSLLEARRKAPVPGSFAGAILAAEAAGQPKERTRAIALSVLLAGTETTAACMTWALLSLAQDPGLQGQLREEAQAAPPAGPGLAEALPLLKRVLMESLRLYPPVWMTGREAREAVEMDGLALRPGELAYLPALLMHRDPRFFEDALAFKPQRWENGLAARLPRFAYFPFGAGPRGCLGEDFAQGEMLAGLSAFLKAYRFEAVPGQDFELKPSITLLPDRPVSVLLKRP